MTLDLDDVIFRARALAQTHPFTPRAQAYLNTTVARERLNQSAPEIGIWAGHAITAGYCLRKVEEIDTGASMDPSAALPGSADLDVAATDIADRLRTETAEGLLLYPEPLVVDALDRLIAGEVERRLWHWAESIDEATYAQLEAYIAWWCIKGYAVRVAEQLTDVEEAKEGSRR